VAEKQLEIIRNKGSRHAAIAPDLDTERVELLKLHFAAGLSCREMPPISG